MDYLHLPVAPVILGPNSINQLKDGSSGHSHQLLITCSLSRWRILILGRVAAEGHVCTPTNIMQLSCTTLKTRLHSRIHVSASVEFCTPLHRRRKQGKLGPVEYLTNPPVVALSSSAPLSTMIRVEVENLDRLFGC